MWKKFGKGLAHWGSVAGGICLGIGLIALTGLAISVNPLLGIGIGVTSLIGLKVAVHYLKKEPEKKIVVNKPQRPNNSRTKNNRNIGKPYDKIVAIGNSLDNNKANNYKNMSNETVEINSFKPAANLKFSERHAIKHGNKGSLQSDTRRVEIPMQRRQEARKAIGREM